MTRQKRATLAVLCMVMVFPVIFLSDGQRHLTTATAAESPAWTTAQTDHNATQDHLRQLLLKRKQILEQRVAVMKQRLNYGTGSLSEYSQAKKAALLARIDLCNTKTERINIYKEIVRLNTDLVSQVEKEVEAGQRPQDSLDEIRLAQLDEEINLLREQLSPEPSPGINVYGRYQLVVSAEGSHAFVIDTITGQVWSRYPGAVTENKAFLLPKLDANLTSINNPGNIITDKADSFVDDPAVIGHWTSVDLVKNISDFKPGTKSYRGNLSLKEMTFAPHGKTHKSFLTWTKGRVYHSNDTTTANYQIVTIDNTPYLFLEWISGDVTLRGQKPWYYVLRKSD